MGLDGISLLRLSGRGSQRHLHLSDGTELVTDLDYLRLHGLREGLLLSSEQWDQWRAAIATHNCQMGAARLLNRRPHTELELKRKLLKRGHAHDEVMRLMHLLTTNGLVDDVRFAQLYSEERLRWAKVGRQRIAGELRQRGVARDTVRETLAASASPEAAALEQATATALAQRKWQSLTRAEPNERQRRLKLYRFLAGRGYSSEVCRTALAALNQPDPEDEVDG